MKKLKTLVLKNSEWVRGQGKGALNVYEKRKLIGHCCLGLLCKQEGASVRSMKGMSFPSELSSRLPVLREIQEACAQRLPYEDIFDLCETDASFFGRATDRIESLIANINDAEDLTDTQRLRILRILFRRLGYRIDYRAGE